MLASLGRWVDDRLGASRFARSALNKVFPDHWSFMIGEVALYCFVVLVVTGTYLSFFFTPSGDQAVYQGSYAPLRGVTMSEAYRSTLELSFDVRAGLVVRQIHHWAALLFLVAIACHVARIFFTGAFRRPRELNWMIGVGLLLLALANGFTGYSLPDDLLSGTGLRIAHSILMSVPLAGAWTAFLLFGGEFPAADVVPRFFVIHILLVPGLIVALLAAHLGIVWRQKHTQFRGPGRREGNVVGSRLWPTYTARTLGLFAFVFAVLAALGGLVQINPVWLYGPFEPAAVSTAAQPDWYLGWAEGALRLFPPVRLTVLGARVPEVLLPGVVLPLLLFGLLLAWPFLEQRVTGDRREHHLLDRPRDRPVRTGIGAAVITFVAVLLVAGAQDLIAQALDAHIATVTWTLRVLVLVLPPAVGLLAWKACRDLSAVDPPPPAEEERRELPPGRALAPGHARAGDGDREPASSGARPGGPARRRRDVAVRLAVAGGATALTAVAYAAGRRYSKVPR